jgi:hypothetical protein
MNLRRAAIGILTAGGLTTGLAVSFGPLGAQSTPSDSPSQQASPPGMQVPQQQKQNVGMPRTLQPTAMQQASQLPAQFTKQIGPYPAPVTQQSVGFGQYGKQFGPLATYMRRTPLRAVPNQGFTAPANAPSRTSGGAVDAGEERPLSSWNRPDRDGDEEATPTVAAPTVPGPRRFVDDEDARPVVRDRTRPFDDEESAPAGRQTRRAQADENENRRQTRGEIYGSELFTKNSVDPYIQYANFTPVSLDAPQRLVNSKKISLQYQVRNAGPSGIALVEVWRTCDGRKWEKFGQQANARPPFIAEVEKEGQYGFTIIPKSGVGLSRKPPVDGEAPQLWVEVDLSPPQVKVNEPVVGTGVDNGKLMITWSAKDKNLGPDPITISYAEESNGEWKTVAAHVRNTGRYVWQMPSRTPYRFLVRVHAVDRAGNVGSDQTLKPVIVDLATPESVILGVDAVGR